MVFLQSISNPSRASALETGARSRPRDGQAPNVSVVERMASSFIGGVLLLSGPGGRPSTRVMSRALGGALLARGLSGKCLLYEALGIDTAGSPQSASGPLEIQRSVTIGKSREELYEFWRNPDNLKVVLEPFAELTPNQHAVHWRIRGPLGQALEWDTEIVDDSPSGSLRWRSVEGSELSHEGEVSFSPAPAGWGTAVTLRLRFEGAPALSALKLVRMIPRAALGHVLRRAKSLLETGEIPTTAPNPAARHGGYGL